MDYCVKRKNGGEVVAIYRGATDERNKQMAEAAVATYAKELDDPCVAAPYTPPAEPSDDPG